MPALKKLSYSQQLLKGLKNRTVRERFVDIGGCRYMTAWLSKLPDGSYPCLNIIEIGLEIVDFLPIERDDLEESGLGKAVEKLRKHCSSDSLKRKALEIINKWKRQILNIDTGYDEDGRHEEQYRNFVIKKQREAKYYKRQKIGEEGEQEPEHRISKKEKEEAKGPNEEGEGDDSELKKQK